MMLSTRCSAVLLALLAPMPLLAAPPSFSASDPRHAALHRLEEAASELYNSDDYALSMSQRTRDAWQRLHDAAVKARANARPHPLAGVALVNLSSMDQLDGKNADALRRSAEGLRLIEPFADAYPIEWMQGLSIEGYAKIALGDVPGGADTLARASRYMDGYIARLPPDGIDKDVHMLRSNIAFIHAQALMRLGRNAEAVAAQKACMDARIAAVGPNSADALGAYYTYAQMLQRADRIEEAEHYARLAVDVATDHVDRKHPNYARALEALGLLLSRTGRRVESLDYLQRAIAMQAGTDQDRDIGQRAYPYLIPALIETGRMAQARSAAATFAAESAQLDNAPAFPLALAAMLAARTGADQAKLGEAARRLVEVVRDGAALNDQGELNEEQRVALDMVLAVAAETQDGPLALDAMAIMAGSRIAQANRLVAQRLVEDPALAARVRTLQDRGKALEAADSRLLKALATDSGVADARAARAAAADAVAAEQASIARDFPRWVEARGAERPDLSALRRDLGADEALLAVMPAFSGVYLMAISGTQTRIERADMDRAGMIALVGRLRDSLSPDGFDGEAAHRLYGQIFTPGIEAVLGKVRSLRIVPTGAFASLPFAMLPQRPVTQARRDTPWLIRRFALTVQPGFAIAGAGERQMAVQTQTFLGVGAPRAFEDAALATQSRGGGPAMAANGAFRRGDAEARKLSALPPLPGSAAELQAVADRFGPERATLLTGADASEAALRGSDLSSYGVILFATHGLVSGEMEGVTEPALVLSAPSSATPDTANDGLLTASEVATMRIGADWVILSACNTAAGDHAQAPAYSGLAQAFRYAGAGALLVSHWPVRDDASAFVTLETVKGAGRGLPRAVALQKAMLKLIRSARPDAVQPYIWAPFILVGR